MKTYTKAWTLWLALAFWMIGATARGQYTTSLSNTGQPHVGSVAVGNDGGTTFREVVSFTTGATNFSLETVTIAMDPAQSGADGFSLSLYGGFTSGIGGPTNLLSDLAGSTAPSLGGFNQYTYMVPDLPINLAANTQYWLVASADASPAVFFWRATTSAAEDPIGLDGWTIGDSRFVGTQFGWSPATSVPMFLIQGEPSAIPEPSTTAFGVGCAALMMIVLVRIARRPQVCQTICREKQHA